MAFGGKLAPLCYIFPIILLTLRTTEAFALYGQPPALFNTPELTARAKQAVTLETHTGSGAT